MTTSVQSEGFGQEEKVFTLHDSNIDIDEAIFHVMDDDEATVVATNAEIAADKISLEEYPQLRRFVSAGDKVWWLQLDDPDTVEKETSDITLGFSTRHLEDQYWFKAAGEPPLHYRLEAERYPTSRTDHPHFLAYHAPKVNNAEQEDPVWSSARAGISVLELETGVDVKDLQWIFTDPGTYEIWVEMVAYVRKENPFPLDLPIQHGNWRPVSGNVTETSEVRRYVIQVGDALDEVEPPTFGVNYSIAENSAAGTALGPAIPIFESEVDDLEYHLSGDGSDDFALVSTSEPNTVQIVVASDSALDYETRASYDLRLSVTDNRDHESNPNDSADDVLGVAVEITDAIEIRSISVNTTSPTWSQDVVWTAHLEEPLPAGSTNVVYHWSHFESVFNDWSTIGADLNTGPTFTLGAPARDQTPEFRVRTRVYLTYTDAEGKNHTTPTVVGPWVTYP